jgi:hypothetical protein
MSTALDRGLWLTPIPEMLSARAVQAFEVGDALGFLLLASNEDGLELVYRNAGALRERGIYEDALLNAYVGCRTNNSRWPMSGLRFLFQLADRVKLLAAGAPLPGEGPFTVYRGVSGTGRRRRVRGFSWTSSPTKARWFAERLMLNDPAVYRTIVPAGSVLAYVADRQESEYIVDLPAGARLAREAGR